MKTAALVASTVLLLTACGGGAGSLPTAQPHQMAQPFPTPTTAATATAKVAISIAIPAPRTNASGRVPLYVSSSTKSATVTVSQAGGAVQPPVEIACTASACNGSIYAPIGLDTFAVNLYDGANGAGSLLSTGTASQTISFATANTVNLTFNGVVHALAVSVAATNAGASTTIPVSVSALDADGHTIIGPGSYVDVNGAPLTITLADGDTSGVTSLAQSSVTQPGQTVSLNYTGFAITPVTITASAAGLASATTSFAPAHPIVITTSDTMNPSFAGIDFYTTSGTGSSGTFSASEAGWTNAPWNKTLSLSVPAGCGTITSLSSSSGTSFKANTVKSPAVGSCTATLSDGMGQSMPVTFAYTAFAYTGSVQTITIPAGVTEATIDATGASGGTASNGGATTESGGLGATVNATVPTTAGSLTVAVGGAGGDETAPLVFGNASSSGGAGGFGGGANGGTATVSGAGIAILGLGGGGGGGTSVTQGSVTLVVAGGGGGAAIGCPNDNGGAGGYPAGSTGALLTAVGCGFPVGGPGGGGTQSSGGAPGATDGSTGCTVGSSGSQSNGGVGGGCASIVGSPVAYSGGGGGGGYFGGGGGGGAGNLGGAGGGGSSYYATPVSGTTPSTGTASAPGNGSVVIIW